MVDMWVALLLSLVAVAYNNIANRWERFHTSAYVPLNLAFATCMTVAAALLLELSRTDLGLRGDFGEARLVVAIVGLFALGAFAVGATRHRRWIADRRVAGLRDGPLAFYVLVRIPLGTAVVEEVVFRGVLFAAWRDAGASTLVAALWASAAFGLWHVTPTIIGVRINDPDAGRQRLAVAVFVAVVLTTMTGLGLTWLRLESRGLVAPILLHAGINSLGALAAVKAGRR